MKKFLLLSLLIVSISIVSSAQYVTRAAKDSNVNGTTRYVTFKSTPDGITQFQLTAVKVSGTVSAYAVLETRVDTITTDWKKVYGSDTLFLTDLTSQIGLWPATNIGNGVRIKIVSSGSQKFYSYFSYLRRQFFK